MSDITYRSLPCFVMKDPPRRPSSGNTPNTRNTADTARKLSDDFPQGTHHLLLRLAFMGTRYHGFQVQQNAATVAQVLQDAIESVFGFRHPIKGCSRTDAGVHARDFAVSFHTQRPIPCASVPRALNCKLPFDIAVKSCREVPPAFHPRYDALAKQYVYQVRCASWRDPFLHGLCLETARMPEVSAMNDAASDFLGVHDFSAFTNTGGSVQDKVRTITQCDVTQKDEMIFFSVTGNGFLYNMVRIMMGTLMEIGLGKRPKTAVQLALSSGRRQDAGSTAPPWGLYLQRVIYPWDL